jgi:hypothetical protein
MYDQLVSSIPSLLSKPGIPLRSDEGSYPTASDFTDEQRKQIFWTKTHWLASEGASKAISTSDDQDVRDSQSKKQGRSRAAEGINVKMRYVVDRNGIPVDGYRAAAIRAVGRSFWTELSNKGIAPKRWKSDASLEILQNYRSQMERLSEELRLCENGWKSEQIAIDNYSSWRNARQEKGRFNVCVKSKGKKQDDDDDDDEDDGDDSEDDVESSEVVVETRKRKARAGITKKAKRPRVTTSSSEVEVLQTPPTNAAMEKERPRPRPVPRPVVLSSQMFRSHTLLIYSVL